MSTSDWLDFTIWRLGQKLDAARKDPEILSQHEKNTIFQIFKAAKAQGNAYKLTGKHRAVVREILRPVEDNVFDGADDGEIAR